MGNKEKQVDWSGSLNDGSISFAAFSGNYKSWVKKKFENLNKGGCILEHEEEHKEVFF